jgi:hypothetical protein
MHHPSIDTTARDNINDNKSKNEREKINEKFVIGLHESK